MIFLLRLSLLCSLVLPSLPALVLAADPSLDAQLRELVERDKVTVVHTWAPWCPNCHVEMRDEGWARFIADHPDVDFAFVEIWNDGRDSHQVLARYGLDEQPNFHRLVDPNPRSGPEKTTHLLEQKLSWVPSTWVFQRGRARYAILYGEIRFDMLGQMIADTTADWSARSE